MCSTRIVTLFGFRGSFAWVRVPHLFSEIRSIRNVDVVDVTLDGAGTDKDHALPPEAYYGQLDEAVEGSHKVLIMAGSLDANLAIAYAASHPGKVAGLVLLNPFFELEHDFLWSMMRYAPVRRVLRWLPPVVLDGSTPEPPLLPNPYPDPSESAYYDAYRTALAPSPAPITTHMACNVIDFMYASLDIVKRSDVKQLPTIEAIVSTNDSVSEPTVQTTEVGRFVHIDTIRPIANSTHFFTPAVRMKSRTQRVITTELANKVVTSIKHILESTRRKKIFPR